MTKNGSIRYFNLYIWFIECSDSCWCTGGRDLMFPSKDRSSSIITITRSLHNPFPSQVFLSSFSLLNERFPFQSDCPFSPWPKHHQNNIHSTPSNLAVSLYITHHSALPPSPSKSSSPSRNCPCTRLGRSIRRPT